MKKRGFEFWQQQALTPDNRYDFHNTVKAFRKNQDFQSFKKRFEDSKFKAFFFESIPPLNGANDQFRDILSARHSNRAFKESTLSQSQLGHVLKTAVVSANHQAAYPSAGALHSVQTYCVINSVQGLQSGVYFYSSKDHSLRQIIAFQDPDQQYELLGFYTEKKPAVTVILTSLFSEVLEKYGQRGWRFIYLEAGAVLQNLHLTSTSLHLKSYICGAGLDYELITAIKSHASHEVYLSAIHISL